MTPSGKHYLATELAKTKLELADMIDEVVRLQAENAELKKLPPPAPDEAQP